MTIGTKLGTTDGDPLEVNQVRYHCTKCGASFSFARNVADESVPPSYCGVCGVWMDWNTMPKSPAPEQLSALGIEALDAGVRLDSLIREAQMHLFHYLQPDSGVSDQGLINTLLGLFDGPEQRDAQLAWTSAFKAFKQVAP